jgi:hypothetical protein
MEDNRAQSYVRSLERTIEMNHHYLEEAIGDLQGMCRIVTPERSVPAGVIVDVRELYKEIQSRLTEIHAIQQLLKGKYHHYARRDPLRDKSLLEMGFIVKTTYSKFENNLKVILERQKAKEREQASRELQKRKILQWFRSRENQIMLIRNMRLLKELNYTPVQDKGADERRNLEGVRSLTLFLIQGDTRSLDSLQSQLRLREHDFIERYDHNELRGVLAHLRQIDPSEVERLIHRLLEERGFSTLKSLLLSVQPHQDLDLEGMDLIERTLEEMKEGEIRTLSI